MMAKGESLSVHALANITMAHDSDLHQQAGNMCIGDAPDTPVYYRQALSCYMGFHLQGVVAQAVCIVPAAVLD